MAVLPVTKNSKSRHYDKVVDATLCLVDVILHLLKVRQGDRGITKVGLWDLYPWEYGRFDDFNNTV